MNTKDGPPPYYMASAPQSQNVQYDLPTFSPTFEPPYMSQPQPHVSHVTVTGGPAVHVPGSCPVCHANNWTGAYSCCAITMCILFFPVGILCCLCMRKKKCSKCGYSVA